MEVAVDEDAAADVGLAEHVGGCEGPVAGGLGGGSDRPALVQGFGYFGDGLVADELAEVVEGGCVGYS